MFWWLFHKINERNSHHTKKPHTQKQIDSLDKIYEKYKENGDN